MIKILKRIYVLFPTKEKIKFFKILFLTFFGAIAETLSIGALFPLISTLSNPENSELNFILNSLGIKDFDIENIFILGILFIIIIYFLKSIYLSALTWWQMGFLYNNQITFSKSLFKSYLTKSYSFHLKRHSSELIRNIITETNTYLTYFIQAGLMLLTEFIVVFFIVLLLIIIQPNIAISLMLFFILGLLFFNKFIGSYVEKWGDSRQVVEGKRMKILQESLGSIKEVLIFGRMNFFFSRFSREDSLNASLARKQSTIMQIPRIWLEVIALLGLFFLIFFLIKSGNEIDNIIPFIAVYMASAFRLLPSFSRIMGSMQSIKYALPVLDIFEADILNNSSSLEKNKKKINSIKFQKYIKIKNLNFRYTGSKKTILNNINFKINKGSIIGIIGQSAAGKSTLIDLLLGLLKPSEGSINVDDVNININLRSWQNKIGYVPQNIFINDESLIKNIAFGVPDGKVNLKNVKKSLKIAGLSSLINKNEIGLEASVGEKGIRLSGGQRQRIGIARALYHNPEILIFDESTSALDIKTESEILKSIYNMRKSKTIILISHRKNTLSICDKIFSIKNGKIF